MRKDDGAFMEEVLMELGLQLERDGHAIQQNTKDIRMTAADMTGQCPEQGREDFDMQWFTDWTAARNKILFRLAGTDRNSKMLAEVPHWEIPQLGLAVIFYAVADCLPGVFASVQVRNSYLEMWGITEEELLECAWNNTPVQMRVSMESMGKILYGDLCTAEFLESIYILSNEQKLYGAGCMFYKGVLKRAAEKIGSGFYVLPSSVHEVMLLPSGGTDRKELDGLCALVAEINRSDVLREEDVLTDEVYYYDMEKHELAVAGRMK